MPKIEVSLPGDPGPASAMMKPCALSHFCNVRMSSPRSQIWWFLVRIIPLFDVVEDGIETADVELDIEGVVMVGTTT